MDNPFDEIVYHFDDASQFFAELDDILEQGAHTNNVEDITDNYISMLVRYQDEYLNDSNQGSLFCSYKLLDSTMYQLYPERVIGRIINRAIQSNDIADMWITYQILLNIGRVSSRVFKWMKENECLPKLKDQISNDDCRNLRSLAIQLLYEVCRMHRLNHHDLSIFGEDFLNYLLDLVEITRDDEDETLNHSVIQLILALNEQFMVAVSSQSSSSSMDDENEECDDENRVLSVLAQRIGTSNTFAENLIFMLNRAVDQCTQMLILKLLYLIFTTPSLYDYFYTNDLHVLVDVIIRELYDLPEEDEALRHAYLRVFAPLLSNTQLRNQPYKRDQISRLLQELAGNSTKFAYVRTVSPTTQRLVERVMCEWNDGLGGGVIGVVETVNGGGAVVVGEA